MRYTIGCYHLYVVPNVKSSDWCVIIVFVLKLNVFFYFLKLLLAFPASGDIGDISAARNCQIRLSDVLVVDLI